MNAVLAVIGTILMVLSKIILVLLLLVCFLLFCPVCYKARAEFGEKLFANGRVCWLLGLVWITFAFQEGKLTSSIRLFGIDLQKVSAWHAKRREKTGKKKIVKKNKSEEGKCSEKREMQSEKVLETTKVSDTVTPVQKEDVSDRTEVLEQENLCKREDLRKRPIKDLWQKIKDFFQFIKTFFKSFALLRKKIKQKADWARDGKKFWKSENTQRMVCILKDNVLHLWRKLKPKVLCGNIIFGTGDPCSTGEILGIAAIFYVAYGRRIRITPDFEIARLEGNLFVKGRISLITIVMILIRIFLSGEWSQFRREVEQLKEAF